MTNESQRSEQTTMGSQRTHTVELDFAQLLRVLRDRADIGSYEDLTAQARDALPASMRQGLSRRWFGLIESGEVGIDQTPVIRLCAIAAALGVTVEDLTGYRPGDGTAVGDQLDQLQALLSSTWR